MWNNLSLCWFHESNEIKTCMWIWFSFSSHPYSYRTDYFPNRCFEQSKIKPKWEHWEAVQRLYQQAQSYENAQSRKYKH
jgi:hypothetical protein